MSGSEGGCDIVRLLLVLTARFKIIELDYVQVLYCRWGTERPRQEG
jgi:hypothetical protein